MCASSGTGRTEGLKLKNPFSPMPIQSARSCALESAVDSPTSRRLRPVWLAMYRIRDTMTSRMGPRSAPRRWISSMMRSPTFLTYPLDCQLRLIPSHFSGVQMMRSAARRARMSGVYSPVSSTIRLLRMRQRPSVQSSIRSLTSALSGAMYTTFCPGCCLKRRRMVSSLETVFPEPVGAPRRTLSSVWYSVWNACVWMGLKWVNLFSYIASATGSLSALRGRGSRSSSSV
mmetsp:Transcript_7893/g.18898  ORF Transcript_7893/g.18898 Transcript_7893/m.18898 type:complete len:230 (+) Transcript_7893:1555-2244(+)